MADASKKRGSQAPAKQRKHPPHPGKDLLKKRPGMGGQKAWSLAVLERDKRKCVECGSDDRPRAHRIKHPDSFPHLAFDLDNGRTLCYSCGDREYRRNKLRNTAKPRRATLEEHIRLLKQEVEDLREVNEQLRTQPGSVMPLDYVMLTLNDPEASKQDKQWAASAGLPYLHKRMPFAIDGGDRDKPLRQLAQKQLRLLTQEEFDIIKRVSGGIVDSLPNPKQVMSDIAQTLLAAEELDDAPPPHKGNGQTRP